MSEHPFRWQDEILELLYWMRGEQLSQEATLEQVNRFLHLEPPQLEAALQQLLAAGLVQMETVEGHTRVQLTARGIAEGQRRFLDDFAPYLGRESHFECGDPECDCHTPGWDGICHSSEAR